MGRIHKMILGGLDLRRYPIPRGYLYSFVVDIVTIFGKWCASMISEN